MADATTQDWTGGNPFLGQNNPYLQQNIDAASADLVKNWNTAQLPAYQAAMLRSGSFGNSAIDELTRSGQDQLQKNLGNLSNTARMQDYQQQQAMYQFQKQREDQNRQWDLGFNKSVYDTTFNQGQQTLQTGIGLLGTLAGYNANDLANANSQQNTPLNYWQQFANQGNALGQGFGTERNTTGSTSNPGMQLAGAAMAGYNLWNQGGGGGGGGITGTGGGNAGAYSTGTTLNNNYGGGYSWGSWGG